MKKTINNRERRILAGLVQNLVPATAIGRRVIECGDEALFRVYYVVVEECEVEERHTAF